MNIKIEPLIESLKLEKIDDSEYFSEKYSEYISNSRLSLINPSQNDDPKAFFEGLSKHNVYSDALIFGSTVHELILQPELFHMCDSVDRPTAKAGFMADELYSSYVSYHFDKEISHDQWIDAMDEASNKVGYYKGTFDRELKSNLMSKCIRYWNTRKEYEDNELTSTPIYLDSKSRERVYGCINALKENKSIQKLLYPKGLLSDFISENEQAILLDVKVTIDNKEPFILKIKAKLDNYTIDTESNTICVNDVKTIGKIVSEFNNNFEKFHYYRELSIYCWLLSLVAKKYYNMDNCTIQSNCLIVSTIPKYYTKIYKVTKSDFIKGWGEFEYLLKLIAVYYDQGYRFT